MSPQVHSYFYQFSFSFFHLLWKPHHCCWLCNTLILVGLATPPHTSLGHKRATSPAVCQQGGRTFITVVCLVRVCTFSGCVGFKSKSQIYLLCVFWSLLIQCLSTASSLTRSTGLPAHLQISLVSHVRYISNRVLCAVSLNVQSIFGERLIELHRADRHWHMTRWLQAVFKIKYMRW